MKQQSNTHLLLLITFLPVIFCFHEKCLKDNEWCSESCINRGYISYGSNPRMCRAPADECSFYLSNDDNAADFCSKCSLRDFSTVRQQFSYAARCIRCSQPDSCADADSSENTKACILIGQQKKKGTIGMCEMPTDCVAAGKSKCSSAAISSYTCIRLGYQKITGTDDCVYPNPEQCLNQIGACRFDYKPCRLLGYEANFQSHCIIPSDCTVGDQCQTPKIACIEAGFTKNSDNDNCVCQGPFKALIESQNRLGGKKFKQCVDCQSDSNACSNACIALGWITSASADGNKCVEPADDDCLAQPNACDSKKFCVVVKGFVAISNTDKACM